MNDSREDGGGLRVLVAGASGFVGRALVSELSARHQVVALSRSRSGIRDGVEWQACDLFSLLQVERAMEGVDVAVYLVYSVLPARLTQASFQDMDFILANNFARAAAKAGVRQIVYLGGLMPDSDALSDHLASRLEVERLLAARGVPVTVLRAGLIIGAGGSSFRILLRLVERLPVMLCPAWTRSLTQPVALPDVVHLLSYCVGRREEYGQTRAVGSPDVMSYLDMMRRTAAVLDKRRCIVAVPFVSPRLSAWWVRLLTGAHLELILPLVESLRHDLLAGDRQWQKDAGAPGLGFEDAVRDAASTEKKNTAALEAMERHLSRTDSRTEEPGFVVSIQRLPLPPGRNAIWVAHEYAKWLPGFFKWVLRADVDERFNVRFRVAGFSAPMLDLSFSEARSTPHRPLFYITGGMLCALCKAGGDGHAPARLEFRQSPFGHEVFAAIFDFRPSIPWPIYRSTQAVLHLWVMRAFGRHLRGCTAGTGEVTPPAAP